MANETKNILLAGIIQAIVAFLTRAGRPDLAAEVEAVLAQADANYRDVRDVANERLGDS